MAGREPTSGRTVALCCAICETTFDHATKGRGRRPKFCSDRCRQSRNGRIEIVRHAPKRGRTLHDLTCVQCGKGFKALDLKRKCCGQECGGKWSKARQTEWRMKRAAERNARTCQCCGVTFRRPRSSDPGKFCSRACAVKGNRKSTDPKDAKKAWKRRDRVRRRAAKGLDRPMPCARCARLFERRSERQRFCSLACAQPSQMHGPRRCKACEVEFTPAHGGAEYCSLSCARRTMRLRYGRRHKERAQYHGVPYEPVNRLKVFERDGWKCQVCGRATPRKGQGTFRDNAPELDHRIPMAMGGAHSYENCQLACRRCNATKGGTKVVGQMPLFVRL